MATPQLFGPFTQIVSMQGLPLKGPLFDEQLTVIENGGIVVQDGKILSMGAYNAFDKKAYELHLISGDMVVLPGLIDCHTHLIWAGNRSQDYALRIGGATYQDILASGGGIFDTVHKTQQASDEALLQSLLHRAMRHLHEGITTVEVKSGYGLSVEQELRMLRLIRKANSHFQGDMIPTCLAAHVCPKDFEKTDFLDHLIQDLLPQIQQEALCNRVDIFVEDKAFPAEIAGKYLEKAKQMGFDFTVHADQFSVGGSDLAVALGAASADHLEASGTAQIESLSHSDVMAVALPGASLGLGINFTPARKLLDAGTGLAIATDWNPGSAPMGDLLVQAAILGAYEKLTTAELLAGITYRGAAALKLSDRGRLQPGEIADFIGFPLSDYREICYYQGKIKPTNIWKQGTLQTK